jgi:hypothetical protein
MTTRRNALKLSAAVAAAAASLRLPVPARAVPPAPVTVVPEASVTDALIQALSEALARELRAAPPYFTFYTEARQALLRHVPALQTAPAVHLVIRLDHAVHDLLVASWTQSIRHSLAAASLPEAALRGEQVAALARGGMEEALCQREVDAYRVLLDQVRELASRPGVSTPIDAVEIVDEEVFALFGQCWDWGIETGAELAGVSLDETLAVYAPDLVAA